MLTTIEIFEKERKVQELIFNTNILTEKEKKELLFWCNADDKEGVYSDPATTAYHHCTKRVYKIVNRLVKEAWGI